MREGGRGRAALFFQSDVIMICTGARRVRDADESVALHHLHRARVDSRLLIIQLLEHEWKRVAGKNVFTYEDRWSDTKEKRKG